jgi:hypothetical protein
MTTWKLNPVVVDLSHYNIADISLMKGNVDLIISKAGEMVPGWTEFEQYDYKFAQNCQAAYDNGIPFGAYIFLSPDDWIVGQKTGGLNAYKNISRAEDVEYQLYRKWVANKVVCAHAMDAEKCYINGVKANGVIPSNWIIANIDVFYKHLKEGIAAKEIQDAPIILYSGDWYAKGFCVIGQSNGFYDWVGNHPDVYIWSADYSQQKSGTTPWDKVRAWFPTDTTQPPYLNSAVMPLLWQFNGGGGVKVLTDYIAAKPNYRETDLSCCSVSKDALYKILKIGTVTPPEPNPEPPAPGEVIDVAARARLDKIETYLKSYK